MCHSRYAAVTDAFIQALISDIFASLNDLAFVVSDMTRSFHHFRR
jgi:hypothetical protein